MWLAGLLRLSNEGRRKVARGSRVRNCSRLDGGLQVWRLGGVGNGELGSWVGVSGRRKVGCGINVGSGRRMNFFFQY